MNDKKGSTRSSAWLGILPLVLLPLGTIALRPSLPAWIFMWALAFAIYAGFKWLTGWQVWRAKGGIPWSRSLGYLFLWPGMDAKTFLDPAIVPSKPSGQAWVWAATKTVLGLVLLWGVVRLLPSSSPLLRGWIGLLGLIFLLHFGLFHLLALFWQQVEVQAIPIMQAPILARSLTDFWGNRWNLGFRELSHSFLFKPLSRRFGTAPAGLAVFFASGLIHDLVISLPAGAGYGLPTAYFILQGLGVAFERSRRGERLGLRQGWRGRLFMAVVTAGPAFWLFHPPFITRVMIPCMTTVGAW